VDDLVELREEPRPVGLRERGRAAGDLAGLTQDVEQLPHIPMNCGTEDPFLSANQEFLRLLMANRVAFTYAQSPGEHRSAYWSREVGHLIAVQYSILRRNLARAGKAAGQAP
jgi:hypothetical protein